MRRGCIAATVIVGGVVALTATPSFAPRPVYNPGPLVAESEVIALFEVVEGDVTPQSVINVPLETPEGFDFHVKPTVRLKVKAALMGCEAGDVLVIPGPLQHGYGRVGARVPVFLRNGEQILAYLHKEDGQLIAFHVERVRDGTIEMDEVGEGPSGEGYGIGPNAWRVKHSVDEALTTVGDMVREWNAARAYDATKKTAERLVADYGDDDWRNERIIAELVKRGDASHVNTLLVKWPDRLWETLPALASIPGEAPVPYLADFLARPCPDMWYEAVQALARPEGKAAVPALIGLTERLSIEERPGILTRIAQTMVALGDPRGVAAVVRSASDPATLDEIGLAGTLPEIIEAVGQSPEPSVGPFLLAHLREVSVALPAGDYDAKLRRILEQRAHEHEHAIMTAAALALAQRGNEEGVVRLLELAEQERRDGGYRATAALGAAGDDRATMLLLEMLSEATEGRQWNVIARALVRTRDERAVEPLLALVRRTKGERRVTLVGIIAEWDHPKIGELLRSELRSRDRFCVSAAALALHNLGDPRGAERLLRLINLGLAGWSPREKGPLYRALGEMNDPRAIRGLIAMMSKNGQNREDIAEALRAITGADLPARPEPWREWWREHRE